MSGAAPPGAAAQRATPMSENEHEQASNRLAAETFMPIMVEAFHDGLKEVASLSRWLLATLVVINGAGVIAVLPLKMTNVAKLDSSGAFLVGVLAALGAGLWSLYAFKRVSIAANTMMGYWLTVAGDGQRLAALEATMKRHLDQAIGSRGTYFFVLASLVAFLVGCLLTGSGLFAAS
jgi:hypothetical protein